MVPSSFRALRWLERLNIAAVGLSLAAATSAVFRVCAFAGPGAAYAGASTLLFGVLWARLLRSPRTVGGGSFRAGWLLSIPLASANAGLSAALVFGLGSSHPSVDDFVIGLLGGMTFGVVIWGPALLLTLLCYGLPIAWAQRCAGRGLAGQERGEVVVGAVSVLMALAALALAHVTHGPAFSMDLPWTTQVLAAGAAVCGGLAVVVSAARARHRRAFVAEVEAGRVERYRIEITDEGKALVRVVAQGGNYRVSDIEEEVAALDREGLVTRAARS